jgi:hypothetical protein
MHNELGTNLILCEEGYYKGTYIPCTLKYDEQTKLYILVTQCNWVSKHSAYMKISTVVYSSITI